MKPITISKQIEICLRENNPISIEIITGIPRINIYFKITNLSNLFLTLDRVLLDIWFGQPTLEGSILRRKLIKPRSIEKEIAFHSVLTQSQKERIDSWITQKDFRGSISISMQAYFESKIGYIEHEERIERSSMW
jgi:hypothetical protein